MAEAMKGRIPSFMKYYEANLKASGGKWLVKGDKPTSGDCFLASVLRFIEMLTPETYKTVAKDYPKVAAVKKQFEDLPNVKTYYESELFNKMIGPKMLPV